MDTQTIALGVAGVGAAVAGGIALAAQTPSGNEALANYRLSRQQQERFDSTLARVWDVRETQRHLFSRPRGDQVWRKVPIVPMRATRWSPEGVNNATVPSGALATLKAIRSILIAAGRGDEDPRCVWALWEKECGRIGQACQQHAIGNVKANWVLRATRDEWFGERAAWIVTPESDRLWVTIDMLRSADVYYGYADFVQAARHHKRRILPGATVAGYRTGGLDGLLAAEYALGRSGYSPAGPAARQVWARTFWGFYSRLLGPRWVRNPETV